MLQRFVILSVILFATSALADVCSYITKEQAELGAGLLRTNPNFIKFCATCSEKSKTKVHAEKVYARPIGNDQYWGVFVNEENIDLAYVYLDFGDNNGINLAKLSGCELPAEVPRRIDIADVAMPAAVAPVAPPAAVVPPAPEAAAAPEPVPAVPPAAVKPATATPMQDSLHDADQYFDKKNFQAAVRLYEDYVEKNPSEMNAFSPKIAKCYYNLGVQKMQKAQTKKDCGVAADYFTHCLFLDQADALATEALRIANLCKEMGPNLPKLQSEIEDLELRK